MDKTAFRTAHWIWRGKPLGSHQYCSSRRLCHLPRFLLESGRARTVGKPTILFSVVVRLVFPRLCPTPFAPSGSSALWSPGWHPGLWVSAQVPNLEERFRGSSNLESANRIRPSLLGTYFNRRISTSSRAGSNSTTSTWNADYRATLSYGWVCRLRSSSHPRGWFEFQRGSPVACNAGLRLLS